VEKPNYFYGRHVANEDRQTRMGEWGFEARHLREADLLLRVPVGWRQLVSELHVELLALAPDYLFFDAYDRGGRLGFDFIAFSSNAAARRVVARYRVKSTNVCVVCGDGGKRRVRGGGRGYILCDACHAADRAAAQERGERYANLALLYFTSSDPAHPTPDELEDLLDSID
jgi:hypothetical protein